MWVNLREVESAEFFIRSTSKEGVTEVCGQKHTDSHLNEMEVYFHRPLVILVTTL